MHKHIFKLFCVATASLIAVFLTASITKADASAPWINSPLIFQKQADTQSIPNSIDGNIDCNPEDINNCSMPTTYGPATRSGTVRTNGSNNFYPVISYIDNRQHFLPIPNSDTFMTYTSEPAFGVYLYFNYSFTTSVRHTQSFGQNQYQVAKPPNGVLEDKASYRLAADIDSMSFSENGQWMVVSTPGAAILRVNLQTFEVLPFAPGFDYSIGLDPAPKTAITNDGRYAVIASKNFNRFKIYDLTTCASVPETINAPVACEFRDLEDFMQQNLPGYSFTSYARFLDDDTLSTYSTYQSNNTSKTVRILIGTSTVTGQIDYLALGDSYISGEGAFDYQGGTDTVENKCHLSFLAYPYLLGHDLNYNSYHSVACSGATTDDIINTDIGYVGQADRQQKTTREKLETNGQTESIIETFLPGHINQLDFVTHYQPKIINLSVGGNDMGFSAILKSCGFSIGTCYSTYEERLELVREINTQVFPKLVQTYQKIKAAGSPDMRFYVIGYPQIAKPGGDCAINVRLNSDEILFSQQLVAYLDSIINQAAAKTGIYYVDAQDALNGHRLCEAGPGSVAMNGLTAGNDRPGRFGGPIGDESYHPNDFGYQLLENKILAATHNLTSLMPEPNLNAATPTESGQEILNAPHDGRVVNVTEYDSSMSGDVVSRQFPTDISIDGAEHSLPTSTTLQAELHSDPVPLGSFTTNASGNLTAQIQLPADIPSGYHGLHFYGTDISGQAIDIYKYIYVGNTQDQSSDSGSVDSGSKDDSTGSRISGSITATPSAIASDLEAEGGDLTARGTVVSGGSISSNGQQESSGQVLGTDTKALLKTEFKPGWLLALLPASTSIFYLARTKG